MTQQPSSKKVTLERILFTNDQNGYFLARTVNGNIVEGESAFYPPIGEEFYAYVIQTDKRNREGSGYVYRLLKIFYKDDDSITRLLLGQNIVKGIAESKAIAVYETLGPNVWNILDACVDAPDQFISIDGKISIPEDLLLSVKGVGTHVSRQMILSWASKRKLFKFLQTVVRCGFNKMQYSGILTYFGEDIALEMINENPYELTLVDGIDWEDVDIIGEMEWEGKQAIPSNSPKRIAAAIRESIRLNRELEGNMAMPYKDVVNNAARLLRIQDISGITDILNHYSDNGLVVLNELITTDQIYRESLAISTGITMVQDMAIKKMPKVMDFREYTNLSLSEGQKNAVLGALEHPVFAVTGGPGTGKTTAFLSTFIAILKKNNISYSLCAPTGAASVRITASTGEYARTIHRTFGINSKYPSTPDTDVIIFDESSMIDEPLLAKVMTLIQESSKQPRLVFIGDADQLPPVGPGFPFRDILKTCTSVRLDTIFRQAKNSNIIAAAHAINRGETPTEFGDDFSITNCSMNDVLSVTLKLFKQIQKEYDAVDIQILTPLNRFRVQCNAMMKDYLNPESPITKPLSYAVGDRVIQLKNNYDLNRPTMNGEVGVCKNIRVDLIEAGKYDSDVLDDAKCVVTSDFTDYEKYPELKTVSVEYPWASVRQLDQAYALTIHKSQGSQYKAIVMVMLPVSRESFLMKQLPYTGITRAEKVVRIVNVQGSLERFINGHGVIQRYSLLSNLIEVSQEKEIM